MVTIDISPILEWAFVILEFAVTWVWIICMLVAAWILYHGAFNQADDIIKGKDSKIPTSRTKE